MYVFGDMVYLTHAVPAYHRIQPPFDKVDDATKNTDVIRAVWEMNKRCICRVMTLLSTGVSEYWICT